MENIRTYFVRYTYPNGFVTKYLYFEAEKDDVYYNIVHGTLFEYTGETMGFEMWNITNWKYLNSYTKLLKDWCHLLPVGEKLNRFIANNFHSV